MKKKLKFELKQFFYFCIFSTILLDLLREISINQNNICKYLQQKMIATQIVSKILASDKQGKQKYSFLLKQLNNPTELKLLFRASQHNFSAAKFHELCDGISDTVTIVRTEFNKTIAAFTPCKWEADPQGTWVADGSKRSFLLQLELKQRMTLIQPQYAICNYQNSGPIFGGGNDLCIAHKCNQNQQSFSNFSCSYNCNGKYQNNQQSYTAFCGSPKGCNFRVTEFQVFVVCK